MQVVPDPLSNEVFVENDMPPLEGKIRIKELLKKPNVNFELLCRLESQKHKERLNGR